MFKSTVFDVWYAGYFDAAKRMNDGQKKANHAERHEMKSKPEKSGRQDCAAFQSVKNDNLLMNAEPIDAKLPLEQIRLERR